MNSLLKRLDSKIMQEKSLTWLATGKYQTTGIHTEILKDLASKAVEGDSRCAVLVFDEIKIKEDLVYCASKPEHSIFDNLEILPGSHQIVFWGSTEQVPASISSTSISLTVIAENLRQSVYASFRKSSQALHTSSLMKFQWLEGKCLARLTDVSEMPRTL